MQAEKSGCPVEVVNHSDFLMAQGGVGCLLRYQLNEFKTRQFEGVKDILKSALEELSGCKILKIESLLCKDNSRIIVATFLNRLENEHKNKEFANE